MAETNIPTKENPRTDTASRIGWGILIILTLYVCYFSHLGAIGFVGPDEPRYAWIARDMMETGDWVTPRLYGKPWFEKPPLFYWGAALCFKLFGVSEAAARLPSAISALLATLALAWLALRLYGSETARWLLLLLPTTVGMIGFSHAAATDMPFSGMLTIAMVFGAVILGLTRNEHTPILPHTPWFALILFGFFLGLAVLAKGPAAIILCGGAVFFWALFAKRWRDALRLFHPVGLASFCLTALPWYILCARRNPDFFHVFIIEHNFKRYLTPEFQHIQPFWFYGPILFIALIPWMGTSICAVSYIFQQKFGMQLNSVSIFFMCWGFFPVLFFSLSKSKLPGYILPAILPFVLVTAEALARSLNSAEIRTIRGFAAIALSPPAMIAAASLSLYFEKEPWLPEALTIALGTLAFLGITACLVFLLSRKRFPLLICGVLSWALFMEVGGRLALPWLDPIISPRVIGTSALPHDAASGNLCVFGLKRGWHYGLNYYQHRELPQCKLDGQELATAYVDVYALEKFRASCIPFYVLDKRSFDAMLILVRPRTSACGASGSGEAHKKE